MKYVFKDLTQDDIKNIIGVSDANIQLLEELYDCGIVYRDDYFKLLSDDEEMFAKFSAHMDYLVSICKEEEIDYDLIKQSFININESHREFFKKEIIAYSFNGKPYKAKTANQQRFIDLIRENDLTFGIGPAGTGKTFLAVVFACDMLRKGKVRKIIVTRPVVEAGESLGFLPGDLKEKVDPYLRPIYDSFDAIFGNGSVERLMEKGVIEIAPLAYMRGRTLNDAVVILDEAQNTTGMQMKMFLTRMGFNSRMIITGDVTQIDLPSHKASGLKKAIQIVQGIEEIAVVEMHRDDVVRHPVVQKIIEAYEAEE